MHSFLRFSLYLVTIILTGCLLAHDVAGDYLAASGDGQLPNLVYAYWELAFILFWTLAVSAFGWIIDMAKIEYSFAGIIVFATSFFGMMSAEAVAETSWFEGAVGITAVIGAALLTVDWLRQFDTVDYWLQSEKTEDSRSDVEIQDT